MSPWRRAQVGGLCCIAMLSACATGAPYERDVAATHQALDAGQPDRARASLEGLLADGRRDGPEGVLLRLELAVVALHQGLPAVAAGALGQADPLLEVVDLTKDDAGEVASWLFADAARPYRSPAWEKLLVNVLGMASRLAAGDRRGALVEARRFDVVARFFAERSQDPGRVLGVGRLLAGVAHEAVGRDRAARLYLDEARAALPALFTDAPDAGAGEVVVLVLAGRLPAKVAQPVDVDTAGQLATQPGAAQNLRELGVKELLLVGLAADRPLADAPVTVADLPITVAWADLAATARADFERVRPQLARAAITRALSRQTVRRTVASADGPGDGKGANLGHLLGGLLAGTMEAGDTPDTRAWSTLPARLGVARLALAPGTYDVAAGDHVVTVEVRAGRPTLALLVVD